MKDVFKALADPNRLKIVECLSSMCQSVNDIAEQAGLSQPLTSHHLKTLRSVGIVRLEGTYATTRFYCLTDETILEVIRLCRQFLLNREKA